MEKDKDNQQKDYPEILTAIADTIAEFLVGRGVPEPEAARVGLDMAEKFRHDFGGEPFYIPKGISFECSKRDMEILEMFDGSNMIEVCRKFGITKMRVYQILQATRGGRQKFLDFDEGEKKE